MDWYELFYNLDRPFPRRLDVLREQLPSPLTYPVRVNAEIIRNLPPEAQNILLREIIFELIPYWEIADWLPSDWRAWLNLVIECAETQRDFVSLCAQQAWEPSFDVPLNTLGQEGLRTYDLYDDAALHIEQCRLDPDCIELIAEDLIAYEWLWVLWYHLDQTRLPQIPQATPQGEEEVVRHRWTPGQPDLDMTEPIIAGAYTLARLTALQGLGSEAQAILAWSPEINRNDEEGAWVPIADSHFVWADDGPPGTDIEGTPRQLRELYEHPPALSDVWARLLAYLPAIFE